MLGVQVPTGWYGSSAWMMAVSVPTRLHMFAQPMLTEPDHRPVLVLCIRPDTEPSEISLPMVHISSSGNVISVRTVWLKVLRKAAIAELLV